MSDLRPTEKLYYQDVLARKAEARVVRVEGMKVVLDRTIFYAEGGGQVGDIGRIGPVAIIDTQKQGGQLVIKPGLPQVNVGTEVVHLAAADVTGVLVPGDNVEIEIDDRGATSVPGVFAAGDCTTVPFKQIVVAMGAGSTAALSAFDHLIRSREAAAA